ncbi:nucleotide exchange factor GrpE [Saccharopolyspora sp. NFXS83]|uniref:nucleotide exchange factor GrpE n=1 Tax=Saccharopolyspora sp. NFXS83 TaxID=2993560 RepID=UPI00224AFA52|nr:nucleotide exchange factor GrpE [Saccharopolyspora sp. NFXS83]MCX2728636.1 nucleotide exchange factor GrpE [Saccharopolyspora sp. NFXS83]
MTSESSGNSDRQQSPQDGEQEPVVVRDRRRIDPQTGEPRAATEQGQVAESMSGTLDEELAKVAEGTSVEGAPEEADADGADSGLRKQVDELTEDLKRVTAEYANYRRRVERDRESVVSAAKASVAGDLLTVLDDLERAESHGDLTGAFKAVADKLTGSLTNAGLEAFGREGDEFDPSVHEAVQHTTSPEVAGPTVTTVMRRGYRFGDRVLRPAMVAVTDHEPEAAAPPESGAETGEDTAQ